MANVIITEFAGPVRSNGDIPAAYLPPLASQTVAIGGASAPTPNAFNNATSVIMIYAEADCNVVVAAAPNAGTGIIIPMGAGDRDYFTVMPGSAMKAAVIARTVS
jgi:hypothetical protein